MGPQRSYEPEPWRLHIGLLVTTTVTLHWDTRDSLASSDPTPSCLEPGLSPFVTRSGKAADRRPLLICTSNAVGRRQDRHPKPHHPLASHPSPFARRDLLLGHRSSVSITSSPQPLREDKGNWKPAVTLGTCDGQGLFRVTTQQKGTSELGWMRPSSLLVTGPVDL